MPPALIPYTEAWDESKWVLVKRVWLDGKMWQFKPTSSCQAMYLSRSENRVLRKYAGKLFEITIPFSYLDPETSITIDRDGKESRLQMSLARMMWVNADESVQSIQGTIVPKDDNVNNWVFENLCEVQIKRKFRLTVNFLPEDVELMRKVGFDPNGDPTHFEDEILDQFPQRLCAFLKRARKGAKKGESKPKPEAKRAKVAFSELHDIHDNDYLTVSRAQIGGVMFQFISTDDCVKILLSKTGSDILVKKRNGEFVRIQPALHQDSRLYVPVPVFDPVQMTAFTEPCDLLWLVWLNAHPELASIEKVVFAKDADSTNWRLDNLEYASRAEISVKVGASQPVILVDFKDESEYTFSTRSEAADFLVEKKLVAEKDVALGAIHEAFCGKRIMLYRKYYLKPATTQNETKQ